MTETGTFTAEDGLKLFERRWEVEGGARAAVIIVHGYGEHCGRYAHFAERLNREGFSVYAYDQRGHGESGGKMGAIRNFDDFLPDLERFIERIRSRIGRLPLFIFGHSMGGLVLGRFAASHEVDAVGLVFSGAAVKLDENVSPLLKSVSSFLAAVAPWLPVAKVSSEGLSREPGVAERYDTDPLVHHGQISARTAVELTSAGRDLYSKMDRIELPALFLHGGEDKLASPQGSRDFYERAGSKDKQLKVYEGGYHEGVNDTNQVEFMDDAIGWMKERMP